ncbi:hypothetical protein BU23DRAFT_602948 [Bimuria novae-zelandiae CBS 107.79]|uniref:Uncharacterized protein n=1 Tax=Bimuria novae-zelandiae CBS 107.79 TaxID=1447943 RepID=A0A6A5UR26_9PLEO|nr:hypothetical protein BU23DRAFT_602948 [Bimuria novae-zelandiae CBS 107.79]
MSVHTYQQKQAMHQRLTSLYARKMRHIPASLFINQRKPTFKEVVLESNQCNFVGSIPGKYDLGWSFSNFNRLAHWGFQACKSHNFDEMELAKGIWFLGLDVKHSFSARSEHSVLNMLCVLFTHALPDPDRVCEVALTADFRNSLHQAFEVNALYASTAYDTVLQERFLETWNHNAADLDVIVWKPSQRDAMQRLIKSIQAVDKLATAVPPLLFPIEHFFMQAQKQPEDVKAERQRAEAALRDDMADLTDSIADMGRDALDYLNDPHSFRNSDLLSALAVPVDENIQPLPEQVHRSWMNPSTAIKMVKGEISGVDDLVGMMANMGVGM